MAPNQRGRKQIKQIQAQILQLEIRIEISTNDHSPPSFDRFLPPSLAAMKENESIF
ncbi:hypothetical protein [Bacillus smithii]|uniref:hypothetical protein n=1 Tax=Bacillus smithii TaxID=1479 RepID=UPI0022E978F5|nr:hypothetical protein [Bacillus smithii]